mgnify:FL=1
MAIDPKLKILVVEDSSTMRNIIVNALRELEIENILQADDGNKALELLREKEVDLILCDWKMPEMSGLEVLQSVRSDPKLQDLPFIMITAEAQKDNVVAAIKQGVSNYVIKPFDCRKLKEKIEKTLALKPS